MDFFDFSGIVPALPGLWNGMIMTLKLMVLGLSVVLLWVPCWH
jgi:hypothetical protein